VLGGAWLFLIMVAYYALKALRDAMAGPHADLLNRLYLATFISTLFASAIYGFVVSKTSRGRLVFFSTQFFVACIFLFIRFLDLKSSNTWAMSTFFVWVSVFNLFIVAMFWSVMADSFSAGESKIWFGVIAAGGSSGSIVGSFLAKMLATNPINLMLTSILCLEFALVLAWLLMCCKPGVDTTVTSVENSKPIGGSLWSGLQHVVASRYLSFLCLYVVLGKFAATFIYNNLQLVLKTEMPLLEDRLALFATMNLWTQSGSLLLQGVVAGLVMRNLGVGTALAIPGLILVGLFGCLGIDDSLGVFVVAQVVQQIVGYGLMTPAQHVLFTVVPREDKYQSKGFIDTVVFRFSDVAAGNVIKWMNHLHWSMSALSLCVLPLMLVWIAMAVALGKKYKMENRE
jgi:ATP:ADP antiporter, AAA family